MADTLSASSGIWWNEATEAMASVVSEASVQAVSIVPSLLERFRQKVANATRCKVVPLAMALGLTMAPACTDKPVQESFVNPNSGMPDATLSKPADTAAVAPVSQSPAQGDNPGLPANVIAQFNASATTPVAETTPVVTQAPEITPNHQPPAWAKGLSGRTARSVLAFSDFVRNTQAEQMKLPENERVLPNETVDIDPVTPVTPDGQGLDQLVNTGSRLPKLSFEQVTGYKTLTPENYTQVVEKLFDTSDIEVWLTHSDGTSMSPEEKNDYKIYMEARKNAWLAKPAEFEKAGKQATIAKWYELFNEFNEKAIYPSREISRRMLVGTNSMAVAMEKYPTLSDEQLKNFDPKNATEREKDLADNYTTQMAEILLMTDPEARMVKITRKNTDGDTLKYMVPSDEAFWKVLHFPGGVQTAQVAMNNWYEQQVKSYAVHSHITKWEHRIAELDTKGKKLDEETAALKSDAAFLDAYHEIDVRFGNLSDTIMQQLKEFPTKRTDTAFVASLSKNLREFAELRKQQQTLEEQGKKMHRITEKDERLNKDLFSTIKELAQANRVPFPTT